MKDIPKEREEELKKEIARGREEITRTILTEAQKIIPQYGIELVDVRIYGKAYNRNPEFYAFLRTLESYKEKTNKNSVLILTTDSDFYQYVKTAIPGEAQNLAPVSRETMP